jgi:membrane-associated protease RseP (regulator of RpoE activity)
MTTPYRTPASIDPDPTPPGRSKTLDRWVRAVSGAAVIFLLAASATMFAMIHDLVRSPRIQGVPEANHVARAPSIAAEAARPPPAPPQCASPPPREAPPPRAVLAPLAPLGLASLGAATHDPSALLARAARLRQDGADLTLTRSLLPMPVDRALAEAFAPHARIAARFAAGGVEIQSLPTGSTALLAGLQRGDVVTAVNGQALTRPESALDAYRSVLATGIAVIEVIRGERRIVLEARFRPAPSAGLQTANHGPV